MVERQRVTDNNQKLYGVVPKDVIAELVGVACWKAFAVDVHEGFGGQTTVRTVAHETPVPRLQNLQKISFD